MSTFCLRLLSPSGSWSMRRVAWLKSRAVFLTDHSVTITTVIVFLGHLALLGEWQISSAFLFQTVYKHSYPLTASICWFVNIMIPFWQHCANVPGQVLQGIVPLSNTLHHYNICGLKIHLSAFLKALMSWIDLIWFSRAFYRIIDLYEHDFLTISVLGLGSLPR